MKTLEEIKKRYAECHGYEDWLDMLRNTGDFGHDRIINDISRQYAIEVAKEALKNCARNFKEDYSQLSTCRESILNESNIPNI